MDDTSRKGYRRYRTRNRNWRQYQCRSLYHISLLYLRRKIREDCMELIGWKMDVDHNPNWTRDGVVSSNMTSQPSRPTGLWDET